MASPNVSEIITTTLHHQSKEFSDAFTNNNALYYKLNQKGQKKTVPGGDDLREPLMYASNGTAGWFSGYDPLDNTPQDVLSAAVYQWKQASVAVCISGLEKRINSGSKEKLFDLLESRIKVAKKSLVNLMDVGAFSDGLANGGKQLGGLASALTSTPLVGIVGGINKANWSFWRQTARSTLTDAGVARSAANIKSECNAMITPLTRGQDKVDLILAGDTDYNYMLEATQAIQQISSSDLAKVGFDALKVRGADFVLCGGIGGNIQANTMYFLNTDYINLIAHSDCDMAPLDPETRAPINQDAIVKYIGWMGNMTFSNLLLQGILTA